MPRPRSTVVHVRPEIRRRVHRRRFFRRLALVVIVAGVIAGTVWQYQETIRPQPVPRLPPVEKKPVSEPRPLIPAASSRRGQGVARPISTTPIPVAALTAAPRRAAPTIFPEAAGPGSAAASVPTAVPARSAPTPAPPPPPALEPAGTNVPILDWFAQLPPIIIRLFEDRLANAIKDVGEEAATIKYREAEFRDLALRHLQQRFPGQLRDLTVRFKAGTIEGTCTATVGPVTAPVTFRAGVATLDDRLHVTLYGMRVAAWEVPKPLLALAESRINDAIISQPARLRLTWIRVEPGQLIVSAELR